METVRVDMVASCLPSSIGEVGVSNVRDHLRWFQSEYIRSEERFLFLLADLDLINAVRAGDVYDMAPLMYWHDYLSGGELDISYSRGLVKEDLLSVSQEVFRHIKTVEWGELNIRSYSVPCIKAGAISFLHLLKGALRRSVRKGLELDCVKIKGRGKGSKLHKRFLGVLTEEDFAIIKESNSLGDIFRQTYYHMYGIKISEEDLGGNISGRELDCAECVWARSKKIAELILSISNNFRDAMIRNRANHFADLSGGTERRIHSQSGRIRA